MLNKDLFKIDILLTNHNYIYLIIQIFKMNNHHRYSRRSADTNKLSRIMEAIDEYSIDSNCSNDFSRIMYVLADIALTRDTHQNNATRWSIPTWRTNTIGQESGN